MSMVAIQPWNTTLRGYYSIALATIIHSWWECVSSQDFHITSWCCDSDYAYNPSMWFWYALLSAIISGISITIQKHTIRKVSVVTVLFAMYVIPLPILGFSAYRQGIPTVHIMFPIAVLMSTVPFLLSRILQLRVLRVRNASEVYPLVALNPLFLYTLGLVALQEYLTVYSMVGMICGVVGVYLLQIKHDQKSVWDPFRSLIRDSDSRIFLLSSVLVSFSAIGDKWALRSMTPVNIPFLILTEQMIMVCAVTVIAIKRDTRIVSEITRHYRVLVLSSIIGMCVTYLVFSGFIDGPVALVSSIKKMEIFFVLLLGILFFHEKPTKYSIIATCIMVGSVFLIRI